MADLQPATEAHARALAPLMRPEDAAEVKASGGYEPLAALLDAVSMSERPLALLFDGEVAAIWGVVPLPAPTFLGESRTAVVWLLTGAAVERHPLAFLKLCRPALRMLLDRYPTLINAIDERYTVAVRWAKWLGFDVWPALPFGVDGLPFHFITISRSPYV